MSTQPWGEAALRRFRRRQQSQSKTGRSQTVCTTCPGSGGPTYRDEGAVPALLGRSSSAVLGPPLDGLLPAGLGLGLPVLAGSLGLGLQAPLVQGEGLLPLQLQPLQGGALVAALAAVVMLPEELDPPAEPLHHRAVSRRHEIRHHQSGFAVNSQLGFRP